MKSLLFDLDDTLLDYSGGVDDCWAAACALKGIGPDAEPAIDTLAGLLGHASGHVASSAGRALASIGAPALKATIAVLETGSPRAREFAADALGNFGPRAKEALPALARVGEDPSLSEECQPWIALAVAEIMSSPDTVCALLTLTTESNPEIVRRAKSAYRRLGLKPEEAQRLVNEEIKEAAKEDPQIAESMKELLKLISSV